ncbi:unnamed protein product [Tilletia controversa]|nr:unnamed protein product [Tilletia controversa]
MEPLYDYTISGLIQIDAIEKTQERYHRFALTASSDHVIYPIGTAYGVHNLEPPMIANITAGVSRPTRYPPPQFGPYLVNERLSQANKKRTIEIIGMRDADRKQPVPTEGSTIYFTGKLYSQQETSKLFTIAIDDYSWVSATTMSPSIPKGPSLPEDPSTPTKRPQLGKRKQATQSAEDEAGPSQKKSSSSYASTSSSG